MNEYINVADIIAIPFFGIMTYYFYKKKNKTLIEYILYLFGIMGFIIDTVFSIIFIYKIR